MILPTALTSLLLGNMHAQKMTRSIAALVRRLHSKFVAAKVFTHVQTECSYFPHYHVGGTCSNDTTGLSCCLFTMMYLAQWLNFLHLALAIPLLLKKLHLRKDKAKSWLPINCQFSCMFSHRLRLPINFCLLLHPSN